jgi:hypothetical protein
MSSELLENLDDDDHGTTVLLSMKASGNAFLWVSSKIEEDGEEEKPYHLPPNDKGWKNATMIAEALLEKQSPGIWSRCWKKDSLVR